ncbi:MAG TPA: molybdopterin cofactor-binding domain-containing protein [Kofleriaceae bacterium]|nr:molybdopterin cofactor-binding domain-containing protein [Kofleriaceae bacterium]
MPVNRREFLVVSAAAGGALVVTAGGACVPRTSTRSPRVAGRTTAPARTSSRHSLHPLLELHGDGTAVVLSVKSEMGQGILTALPMLLAEELDLDWSAVRVERERFDPALGSGGTTASISVFLNWKVYREAGALVRHLLVAAAAKAWSAAPEQCRTERGAVIHRDGRRLGYGELAAQAASMKRPRGPIPLKSPAEFRLIGRPLRRIDTPDKVSGAAGFGIDVQVPGMLVATVLRPPVHGATLATVDDRAARAVPGVEHVVRIERGVAVVARDTWSALQGRERLSVTWNEGAKARLDSAGIAEQLRRELRRPGHRVKREGDPAAALARAAKRVEATYEFPFVAHATMEPMNCTAHVEADRCTLWAPTQTPGWNRTTAARITGLPEDRIIVHRTFLGGGFGRRSQEDFVAEAVEVSRAVRRPVKVVWTRTDDLQHDFYRPTFHHRVRGGIDAAGAPLALDHRLVGPSVVAWWAGSGSDPPDKVDDISIAGAERTLYRFPHFNVETRIVETGVPVGIWRSIGNSYTTFVGETFIDELAAAAGRDPVRYRLDNLRDAPRVRAVLELAADKAGWSRPPPAGRHRGVAVFAEDEEGYSVQVAQVAEISVDGGGDARGGGDGGRGERRIRVHRVVCAIDCGIAVNPNIIAAQMEGGIAFGLSAALKERITLARGRVVEANFDSYRLLRLNEMPEVEVHIVPSQAHPGGVGEKAVSVIAPAVANAVFAATGVRLRSLPLRLA